MVLAGKAGLSFPATDSGLERCSWRAGAFHTELSLSLQVSRKNGLPEGVDHDTDNDRGAESKFSRYLW